MARFGLSERGTITFRCSSSPSIDAPHVADEPVSTYYSHGSCSLTPSVTSASSSSDAPNSPAKLERLHRKLGDQAPATAAPLSSTDLRTALPYTPEAAKTTTMSIRPRVSADPANAHARSRVSSPPPNQTTRVRTRSPSAPTRANTRSPSPRAYTYTCPALPPGRDRNTSGLLPLIPRTSPRCHCHRHSNK